MAAPFLRSLSALGEERGARRLIGLAVGALLLAGWCAFAALARVPVYAVSERARLEVEAMTHPLEATRPGRVVRSALELGRAVAAGDVLVELDATVDDLRVREEEARIAALERQVEAARSQRAAESDVARATSRYAKLSLEQAPARMREAETGRKLAEEEARQLQELRKTGAAGEIELLRAKSEAERRRAETDVLGLEPGRMRADTQTRESAARARAEGVRRDLASLEGDLALSRATLARIQRERELLTLRAPVAGTLADVAELRPGRVLREGERVASVVPPGRLRTVAELTPAAAFGRVRAGQHARMRLDGFPWTEFGVVELRVARVAGEVRDGRVRVELAVLSMPRSVGSLEHGAPGVVEIEVERPSPLQLLLRAAGRRLGAPADPPQ